MQLFSRQTAEAFQLIDTDIFNSLTLAAPVKLLSHLLFVTGNALLGIGNIRQCPSLPTPGFGSGYPVNGLFTVAHEITLQEAAKMSLQHLLAATAENNFTRIGHTPGRGENFFLCRL